MLTKTKDNRMTTYNVKSDPITSIKEYKIDENGKRVLSKSSDVYVRCPNGNTIKTYEGNEPSLKDAQDYVGGWVQGLELNNGDYMLFDEEGLLKNLTLNLSATKICKENCALAHQIVGNAIIIKADARKEW